MSKGRKDMEKPWLKNYVEGVPENIEFEDAFLPDFLETWAAKCPDTDALIFQGFKMSYKELKDKLEAADIWVSEIVNHGFIHSIYTFDPNNIAIEFSAPVPAVDIRRDPKMKDKRPSTAALEGPEPQSGHWPEPETRTPPEERVVYPGEGAVFEEETDT